MDDFYDRLAPLYDLIFLDWDASMEQQAGHLAGIIGERWGADVRTILDVACGIGTQSIGLARRGLTVAASDLSAGAVERAKVEARRRGVEIEFSVCDMRVAHDHHGRQFDLVIACDNAIPHLPELQGAKNITERQWMRGPYRIERLGGWLFEASPLGIEHRAAIDFGGSYLPLDSPVVAENATPLLPALAGRAAAGLRLFHVAASS